MLAPALEDGLRAVACRMVAVMVTGLRRRDTGKTPTQSGEVICAQIA
ncbi:hypothetical protein ACP2AV_06180 [Aliiroseovarius sp. PTFE2010]